MTLGMMDQSRFSYLCISALNSLPDGKILDWFKLKEFADDNFRFDENCRKLSKWVENTVGKGEIARYEQFLLFPQYFQKTCFPGASKGVIVWEWVKHVGSFFLVQYIRGRGGMPSNFDKYQMGTKL